MPIPADAGVRTPAASPIIQKHTAASASEPASASSTVTRTPISVVDVVTSRRLDHRAASRPARVDAHRWASAPTARIAPVVASSASNWRTKNAPMKVSTAAQAPKATVSPVTHRRADLSWSTRPTPAVAIGPQAPRCDRAAASPASATVAGTSWAARHDTWSVTRPTTGATTTQASEFPPATQPRAPARVPVSIAATPENAADSRQANPTPARAWAARKIANVGAAAIAAEATTARPAPSAASEEMSRTRVPRMSASDAAIATTAVTDRACPTAVTDEPRSWATEEIVGLRTTSIAWEPIAQSTSGDRRTGGV